MRFRYVATDDYIGAMYTSSSAQEGLTAQLWKIVYEDGEEVSRDTVNYSQYNDPRRRSLWGQLLIMRKIQKR